MTFRWWMLQHFYHSFCCTISVYLIRALRFVWLVNCALIMAESDRSRSPLPSRNRLEPRGQAPPLPSELPFFPRWCGPMNASVRHFQNMSRPQNRPNWPMNPSGPYMMGQMRTPSPLNTPQNWQSQQFPRSPPSSMPPTLPYPTITSNHSHLPTYDAMPTNTTVLSRHTFHLSIPASVQRHSSFKPTVQARKQWGNQSLWVRLKPSLARGPGSLWQSKSQWPHSPSINSTIGFYSKAGDRGMWPSVITRGRLAVPTSQQSLASEAGSWSWSLPDPHGGHRSCCIHHWNAHAAQKPRHRPGQSLSLPSSTGWETTWHDSQHKISRSTDSRSHSKLASCPHHRSRFPTWDHKAQKWIGWTSSTCWRRSWRHRYTSKNWPIGIQPCHHTNPKSPPEQFHKPNTTTTIIRSLVPLGWSCHRQSLAHRTHANHLRCQSLQQMAQRPANIRTKAQGSYREHHQDRDLVVTPTGWSSWNRRTCGSHDGHPSQLAGQKLWGTQPSSCHDSRHQPHQLTSSPAFSQAKAQGASIPFAHSPLDDSDHLYFDALHHDPQHPSFSRLSHHPNTNDGARRNPRSSTQSEAEVNFGRMYQSYPSLGINTPCPQPFFQTIFPIPERLHSFHPHHEHATQVLCWVRNAPHPWSGAQSFQKISSTQQRTTCTSWIGSSLLARAWQPIYLGSHSHLHGESWLSMPWTCTHSRMAASPELPIHLPIFPSKKGNSQKTCPEYKCTVWPGNLMASCKTQVHPTTCQGYLGIRPIPEPPGALDHHPRFRFKQQSRVWTNQDAPIPWRRPYLVLCSPTSRQQHPGALSHTVSSSNRHFNQMVARQTGTASLCLALTLVSHSKSSTLTEKISSEMAPPGAIIPSPMPQPVLQNGLHQTCSCTRPTMQPQTGHHRLFKWSRRQLLLQTLAEIQDSKSQSIRTTLGFSRISTSLATSSWPCSHRWRILAKQGIPIQKGIPHPTEDRSAQLDKA